MSVFCFYKRLAAATLLAAAALPHSLWAEVFVLKSGGRLEGEILNSARQANDPYEIRTPDGIRWVLDEKSVQRVIVKSDVQRQYEDLLPKVPNTVAGQWSLAQWCKEAGLTEERTRHLLAVVALDPDHEEARKALGYTRFGTRWMTLEEFMASRGFVRAKGGWRTPQEVAIEEAKRQQEEAVVKWRKEVRRAFGHIKEGNRHAADADRFLQGIADPTAAPALAEILADSGEPKAVRLRCLEILARLPPGLATPVLLRLAMEGPDQGIRDRCLDEIKRAGTHLAVPRLVAELKSKNNSRVNRAAECLGQLEDKDATLPLIEALVTEHQELVSPGGPPGGLSLSFGSGGASGQSGLGSFGVGGQPKAVKRSYQNTAVRNALTQMYPGVNFGFDEDAWRRWYIQTQTSTAVDLRRDE